MSLSNKLQLPWVLDCVKQKWSDVEERLLMHFDTTETKHYSNDAAGTWPVIKETWYAMKASDTTHTIHIKLEVELRDPWLAGIDRKLALHVLVGIDSNTCVLRFQHGHEHHDHAFSFTEKLAAQTIIGVVDKHRQELRVKYNGKRLQHWYKEHAIVWKGIQIARPILPGYTGNQITISTKSKSNPDNALVDLTGFSNCQVQHIIENTRSVFDPPQKHILPDLGFGFPTHFHYYTDTHCKAAEQIAPNYYGKKFVFGKFIKQVNADFDKYYKEHGNDQTIEEDD